MSGNASRLALRYGLPAGLFAMTTLHRMPVPLAASDPSATSALRSGRAPEQSLFRTVSAAALAVLLLNACTDGATRIAYDLEKNASAFSKSTATQTTIRHLPERSPDGCGAAYTVQMSANAALLIWCKDAIGGTTTTSHATSYHLRFVQYRKRGWSIRPRVSRSSSSWKNRREISSSPTCTDAAAVGRCGVAQTTRVFRSAAISVWS